LKSGQLAASAQPSFRRRIPRRAAIPGQANRDRVPYADIPARVPATFQWSVPLESVGRRQNIAPKMAKRRHGIPGFKKNKLRKRRPAA
jgi:hypothetical protein